MDRPTTANAPDCSCFTATRNACKLCAPLGACLAFRGVEGAVPFLHGSQGCSTYIRRYMISHFKEPIDIACANFGEAAAIFGGQDESARRAGQRGAPVSAGADRHRHDLPGRDDRRGRADVAARDSASGTGRRPAAAGSRVHAQLCRHSRRRVPCRRACHGRRRWPNRARSSNMSACFPAWCRRPTCDICKNCSVTSTCRSPCCPIIPTRSTDRPGPSINGYRRVGRRWTRSVARDAHAPRSNWGVYGIATRPPVLCWLNATVSHDSICRCRSE